MPVHRVHWRQRHPSCALRFDRCRWKRHLKSAERYRSLQCRGLSFLRGSPTWPRMPSGNPAGPAESVRGRFTVKSRGGIGVAVAGGSFGHILDKKLACLFKSSPGHQANQRKAFQRNAAGGGRASIGGNDSHLNDWSPPQGLGGHFFAGAGIFSFRGKTFFLEASPGVRGGARGTFLRGSLFFWGGGH